MNLPWEGNGLGSLPSNHLGERLRSSGARFASSWLPSINWQGSHCGGRDDIRYETRVTHCAWHGDIRCRNRGGGAAWGQRGGTETPRGTGKGGAPGGGQNLRNSIGLR